MRTKREEELARLFQAVTQGEMPVEEALQQIPEQQDEFSELLGLADSLQGVSLPKPDPRFRSAARARILAAVATTSPVTFQGWLRHLRQTAHFFLNKRPALTIALSLALLFSLMGAGSAFAAKDALPGAPLYPLKLQVEDLRLFASSADEDAVLYRQFAEVRVEEVRTLIAQGHYEDIPAAVERMENLMTGAALAYESAPRNGRQETIVELSNSLAVLVDLLDRVPDAAKPGLENALDRSGRTQEKLDRLFQDEMPAEEDEQQPEGSSGRKPDVPPNGKPEQSPQEHPTQAQDEKPGGKPADQNEAPAGQPDDHPEKLKKEKPDQGSADKPHGKPTTHPGRRPTQRHKP
jgi:hypothetical protein